MISKTILEGSARRIWRDFSLECHRCCAWRGDPAAVGECYCQRKAWDWARLALDDVDDKKVNLFFAGALFGASCMPTRSGLDAALSKATEGSAG